MMTQRKIHLDQVSSCNKFHARLTITETTTTKHDVAMYEAMYTIYYKPSGECICRLLWYVFSNDLLASIER